MSTEASKSFNIENGPSVGLLVDAFKYAYDKIANVPVTFVVAKCYTAPLEDPGCAFETLEMKVRHISMLQHESGNNHSFKIEGYCDVALGEEYFTTDYDAPHHKRWTDLVSASFSAFYDAKTRKGKITFLL